MAYAIDLFLDEDSDRLIRDIWQELAENDINNSMMSAGNRPHLTLAMFDDIDIEETDELLRIFSDNVGPIILKLIHIGVFPDKESTVFLGAAVEECLLNIHNEFHELFRKFHHEKWDVYLPGEWIPHCTVAIDVSMREALNITEYLIKNYRPLEVKCISIGLVEYPPARVISTYGLKG